MNLLIMLTCIFVALNIRAATFTASEVRKEFNKNNVYPLNQYYLHEDIQNKELVHVGRLLFFDKVLSGNKDISCATCHFPSNGTSDNLPVSVGTGGRGLGENRVLESGHFIPRNAPALFNMGYYSFDTTMWDGRIAVDYLEKQTVLYTPEPLINGHKPVEKNITKQINSLAAAQALFPVTSRHEMRGQPGENEIANALNNLEIWQRLTHRITTNNRYVSLFKNAYRSVKKESDINYGHIARAIGAFEMASFRADQTNFDRFLNGYDQALTRSQLRGASLFVGKAKCISCHNGPHLTDFKNYSSGMPQLGPGKKLLSHNVGEDLGLMLLSKDQNDLYCFKTPTLRNVQYTGPWSHAGAYNNLKNFLKHHVNSQKGMELFLSEPHKHISNDDYVDLIDFDISRNIERVASTDSILKSVHLSTPELNDVYNFLMSLSDLDFYNSVSIPSSVPSGLPVKD